MPRQQPAGNFPVVQNDANGGTITMANELKPADVPVETMLGVANGAVTGALLSSAVSGVVTLAKEGRHDLLQNTASNITGSHLVGVICGTAAVAALSGMVRFSRARTHNQWREEHYDFLRGEQQNHAEKIEAARDAAPAVPVR